MAPLTRRYAPTSPRKRGEVKHTSAFPRRDFARVVHVASALETKGAGNAGRSTRPQPCVQMKKAHKCSHHGHIGFTRHSPRAGFNKLPRALPGDQGFVDTVTGG
jgi:hypothetical protein